MLQVCVSRFFCISKTSAPKIWFWRPSAGSFSMFWTLLPWDHFCAAQIKSEGSRKKETLQNPDCSRFSEELLSNCWQPFPSVECSLPQPLSADAIGLGKKEQGLLRKDKLLWDLLLCGSLITEMWLVQTVLHTQQREGLCWWSMGTRHSCPQGPTGLQSC